jgi:hypothetical protein
VKVDAFASKAYIVIMTDIVFIRPNQQQLFHHLLDVRHLKNTTNVEVVV